MSTQQPISAQHGILIGVTVALLLQSVNGYLAYRAATDYVAAAGERRESLNILKDSEELLSLLKDAETGHRGYLLTGDESYLNPYRTALPELTTAQDRFRQAAEKQYAETVAATEPLISSLFARLGESIELRRTTAISAPLEPEELTAVDESKRLMDGLRRQIGGLEAQERIRLTQITQNMDRLARENPPRVLLVSSLAVVLVGAAGWVAYRDVRRRAEAEQKVREQRKLLDSVLDNISDGVLFADAAGRLQWINRAAQRMHGQDGTHIPQSRWSAGFGLYRVDKSTLVPNDELPLSRALRGESVDQEELFLQPPHGAPGAYLSVSGRPIMSEQGELLGGVIVLRDVTRQKHAALRDQEVRAELETLVALRTGELQRSNQELQHKNHENETFVYSVSHDLRSPLVNLQGFSQELGLSVDELRRLFNEADVPAAVRTRGLAVLDDDVAASLRFIQSAVLRLADIINALLQLSRAGRVEYQLQTVAIEPLVRRIVDSLHSELSRHGATIEVGPLPEAWGDSAAVAQIFANLLENAVKYLDPQRPGRIEVGALAEPDAAGLVTYFVRDNGLGLPEAGRDKIFKAFERFHPQHAAGDGMGLTIVRRIVERHGGTIRFDSVCGAGSTFYVSLPAVGPTIGEPTTADVAAISR